MDDVAGMGLDDGLLCGDQRLLSGPRVVVVTGLDVDVNFAALAGRTAKARHAQDD